ncbi:MutS-related protein [Sessilibacter corallicola]|uniref:MutS family DNA mismatch repair protein n=1 Tax=Sessilibacter corallicola TaxID=2904075 RepID=A0ABQ0ABQ2_9GAMM
MKRYLAINTENSARAQITEKLEHYTQQVAKHSQALALLSRYRTVSFIGFVITLFFVDRYPLLLILSAAVLAVFFGFVARYKKVTALKHSDETLLAINRRSMARMNRDWENLEAPEQTESKTVFWQDLNIGGARSIISLLSHISSPLGLSTLKSWLEKTPTIEDITERQAAHQDLKNQLDFRQTINALGLQIKNIGQLNHLVDWLQSEFTLVKKPKQKLIALRCWNGLGALLILLVVTGVLSAISVLAYVIINAALLLKFRQAVTELYYQINIKPEQIENLTKLSQEIEQYKSQSSLINYLQSELFSAEKNVPFSEQLLSLYRLILLSELRLSAIPYILASLFLAWDLHVFLRLQHWASKNTHAFDQCIDAISQFESLSILAAVAYENPTWTLPHIQKDRSSEIVMEHGGHPLLKQGEAIRNSLTLTPNDKICVITGSHMSGKTTFLRTLGVNAKLAMIGSVVCAQSLSMPRLEVLTSMHISDSLLDGVSLFMAEVIKIKTLIDILEKNKQSDNINTLFLLDEVLRGSNDLERKLVFTRLLNKLDTYGGYGLISTNDISIAKSDEVNQIVSQYHFQESLSHQEGSVAFDFDYKLRSGVVAQTNAMQILQSMSVI